MSTHTIPQAALEQLDRELATLSNRIYDVQVLVHMVREALDASEAGQNEPLSSACRTLAIAEELAGDLADAVNSVDRCLRPQEAA